MKKVPVFNSIDRATRSMAQQFYYYTEMAPTIYTVNVTLDVMILRKTLKANSYKFFLAYRYLLTSAISKQPHRNSLGRRLSAYIGRKGLNSEKEK